MRISREARVLLAFVAVAGAAWVWINFFSQPTPGVSTQTPTTPTVAPDAIQADDADTVADDTVEAEDDAGAADGAEAATGSEGEAANLGETDAVVEDDPASAGADPDTEGATTVADAETDAETGAETANTPADSEAQPTADEGAPTVATPEVDPDTDTAADSDASAALAAVGSEETAEEVAEETLGEVADEATGEDLPEELPGVDLNETAAETGTETSPEEAVESSPSIATAQPVTAREIEVAELPFLVTEPPAPDAEAVEGEENGLELSRPRSGLRATVNPFSPLVVQAPPAPALAGTPPSTTPTATATATATAPTITEVPIPGRPGTIGQGIAPVGTTATGSTTPGATVAGRPDASPSFTTPTPRPLTPGATQVSNLPRPLPGGILTSTPDILRNTRVTPVATPTNALGDTELASVAALRVPGQSNTRVDFDEAPPAALEPRAESDASPLPLVERRPAPPVGAQTGPLVAGASGLSRYLRDNNYQFTGSVIGPVGVGVFRSNLSATPITVVLGQQLLDTNIVLTSLKGKQAEFTQDDEKQVLTLDLR